MIDMKPAMIDMKLVKVVSQEQRALVVLLDLPGRRVLPLWLHPMEGFSLGVLLKLASPRDAVNLPFDLEVISGLLRATGGTVQAVHIEERANQVLYARLLLHGSNGNQEVKTILESALAVALYENSPIMVTDEILRRIGVSLPLAEDIAIDQQIDKIVETLTAKTPLPFPSLPGPAQGKEPQNLQFTQGLEHWELRGSFLLDQSGAYWEDYVCGTEATGIEPGEMCSYLKALVPQPLDFANLGQMILADDYRGKRVLLSAEIKTVGVEQRAGLCLRFVEAGRMAEECGHVMFQGNQDWVHVETCIDVPANGVFVLFGMILAGVGQVWMKNVRLEGV